MLKTCYLRMFFEHFQHLCFHIIQAVLQDRTGINKDFVVDQETGYAQGSDHFTCLSIKMLVIIINIPVDTFVDLHIDAGVI